MSRLHVVLGVLLLWLASPVSPAGAVTVRDIVELSKAGLADEIVLELIAVDRTIFSLTADQLIELRQAGVSERVILAMLRSGRVSDSTGAPAPALEQAAAAPVGAPLVGPTIVVINQPPAVVAPPAVVVPFAYPIYVGPRTPQSPSVRTLDRRAGFGRFMNDGWRQAEPVVPSGEPVYWGWGGKRRPDTWAPAPVADQP